MGSLEGDGILTILEGETALALVQGHRGPCKGGADEGECNESEVHPE